MMWNRRIILILIFCPLFVKAQFHATYNGFRTSDDKEYLVLTYDQQPIHKLYSLTGKWINRTQYNPNIYTKDILDESIYVHMYDTLKLPGVIKTYVHIDYGLSFEFKDGKIRLQPIIHSIRVPNEIFFGYEGKTQNLNNVNLFKPDGSYRGKNGKNFSRVLDEWLNKLVAKFDVFIKSSGGEDDW